MFRLCYFIIKLLAVEQLQESDFDHESMSRLVENSHKEDVAQVYKATSTRWGPVVLKQFSCKGFQAFEQERKINEKLFEHESPCKSSEWEIAQYYGNYERKEGNQHKFVLVFKYYDAQELLDFILKNHPGTLQKGVESFDQWSERVKIIFKKMIHLSKTILDNGISHLDISIENYLLDKNGKLILIDFGSAIHKVALTKADRNSVRIKHLNTPPEWFNYYAIPGPPIDVYAMGTSLATLYLGAPLYGKLYDENYSYWRLLGLRGYIKDTFRGSLPLEAVELLEQMLDKNNGRRITVEQILDNKFLQ